MDINRKIIFVTPSLKTGGGNRVFIELANALCCKYDIHIVAPNNSNQNNSFYLNSKVVVQVIGALASNKIHKLINILLLINHINTKYKDDYVICSDPIFCLFLPLLRVKCLYRFIQADDYRIFDDGSVLGRGILLYFFKLLTLHSYKNRSIRFVFNSYFVYNLFIKDSQRIDVTYLKVYPAINHDIFNHLNRVNHTNTVTICSVARKHKSKGLQDLLDAIDLIPYESKIRISKIILISHDDLSSFSLNNYFEVIIPASDFEIASILKESDIFISTSWREGFGLPPLEAMACGCSVICSNSGGVNEYLDNNNNSLMFMPKDVDSLSRHILTLMNDDNLRLSLSTAAIQSAKYFRWYSSAEQLIKILSNDNRINRNV